MEIFYWDGFVFFFLDILVLFCFVLRVMKILMECNFVLMVDLRLKGFFLL